MLRVYYSPVQSFCLVVWSIGLPAHIATDCADELANMRVAASGICRLELDFLG